MCVLHPAVEAVSALGSYPWALSNGTSSAGEGERAESGEWGFSHLGPGISSLTDPVKSGLSGAVCELHLQVLK